MISTTRVAPQKKHTLPRLELMGAVTAAKLVDYAKTALTAALPVIAIRLWTDSQIVLHWLASNKPLSQFITNRV